MTRFLTLGLLCLPLVGCFHTTYATGARRAAHHPSVTGTNHFFLWGLANDATVDAGGACRGGGPSKIDVHKSFLDGFLSVLTLGIYTPRSYEVWCAAPAAVPLPAPGQGGAEVTP